MPIGSICVARRHQQLTAEITRLDAMLDELVRHAAPEQFLAKRGVATQVAVMNAASEDTRRIGAWIAEGAIGPVRQVRTGANRVHP